MDNLPLHIRRFIAEAKTCHDIKSEGKHDTMDSAPLGQLGLKLWPLVSSCPKDEAQTRNGLGG